MLLAAVTVVGALALAILVTGHLAAAVVHQGWPRYRLGDAPGIIARVVTHPDDPASKVFTAIAERLDVEMAPKRIYRTQLKIV